jgi:hypothetical protein
MNLPGFTADSAVGASHKQYRMSPSFQVSVRALPQQLSDDCNACLDSCLAADPVDPAVCGWQCWHACRYRDNHETLLG